MANQLFQNFKNLRADLEAYKNLFSTEDKLGRLFAMRITELTPTECWVEYTVKPEHFNPNGILHGGALYSVMDSGQGAFVHFILDEKYRFAATGTSTIRYTQPVTEGLIKIRTWLEKTEGRKLFIRSTAFNKDSQIVAELEEIWIAVV